MSAETKETPELAGKAAAAVPAAIRERMHFYRVRHKVYTALLVFVVVTGLPVIGVPFLRNRLNDRVQVLKMAIVGNYSRQVTAKVGENHEPFPQEYEQPLARRNYPQLPAYLSSLLNSPTTNPNVGQVYPPPAPKRPKTVPKEQPGIEKAQPQQQPEQIQQAQQQPPPSETPAQEAEPVYRQGKIEQEIYDILLKSDANVAGLVQNKNAALHFKSWDVAKREEDLYWVRIIFTQMPAKTDLECIWQVQLMSKQVMPLNYGARSLPRS